MTYRISEEEKASLISMGLWDDFKKTTRYRESPVKRQKSASKNIISDTTIEHEQLYDSQSLELLSQFNKLNRGKGNEKVAQFLLEHQFSIVQPLLLRPFPPVPFKYKYLDKKTANLYFLCCSVDRFPRPWEEAWDKGKKFVLDTFGNPENLWNEIVKVPESVWKTEAKRKELNIHPYQRVHDGIWDSAKRICNEFEGDARKIWRKGDPNVEWGKNDEFSRNEILNHLEYVLFNRKEYSGKTQMPRWICGCFYKEGQIDGPFDPKADIHVVRVVGRVFYGLLEMKKECGKRAENIAIHTCRMVYRHNPFLLDEAIFFKGNKEGCIANTPDCINCSWGSFCLYNLNMKREIPELPDELPKLSR